MIDTPGLCISCNYQLRGLVTPRCPECGREFDPNDPSTMNMGRKLSALDRFVLGPIRWPVISLTAGATGFVLWLSRLPGGRKTVPLAAIGVLGIVGLLWLVWPMMRAIVMKRTGWTRDQLTAGRKPRWVVGAVVVFTAIAVYLNWPMQMAFWVSRPAMTSLANRILQSPNFSHGDQWIGFYKVQDIRKASNGVKITVEENVPGRYSSGFIYLPQVDPKRSPFKAYQFIGNGWWSWREDI
jgi:hypothetical protein